MQNTKKIEVSIVNAFTADDKGGNPAGVVLNADTLTNTQKQQVAALAGLPETAFVSASKIAGIKLEFFTPTRQIAHCGHATIATFSYLKQNGLLASDKTSKETIDGIRQISIEGDMAFMEQKAPVYTDVSQRAGMILSSLGLTSEDVAPQSPVMFVSTGNSFAIIHVAGTGILKKLKPDFDAIKDISETFGLIGYYVFATPEDTPHYDATARMFAPAYGINEEAATGMAAGPLACYLHDITGLRKNSFIIQQGVFMDAPSPSRIEVSLTIDNGNIAGVLAGGKGKVMEVRTVAI